jgi:hypothetical protein
VTVLAWRSLREGWMRRREFIAGLGGAAAWPLVARGQPATPVIGFLGVSSLEKMGGGVLLDFKRGLAETATLRVATLRSNIAGRKSTTIEWLPLPWN